MLPMEPIIAYKTAGGETSAVEVSSKTETIGTRYEDAS
jgi:hypothetical protein